MQPFVENPLVSALRATPSSPPFYSPVSGAPIPEERRFNYLSPDGAYRLFGAILENSIVWISPEGYSRRPFIMDAFSRLDRLINRHVSPSETFVLINDIHRLKRISFKARLYLVNYAKCRRNMAGIVLCRVPAEFRLSVQLARRARIFPFELHQASIPLEAVQKALTVLDGTASPKGSVEGDAALGNPSPSPSFDEGTAVANMVDYIGSITIGGTPLNPNEPAIGPTHPYYPFYRAIRHNTSSLNHLLIEKDALRNRLRRREAELIQKNNDLHEINTTMGILLEKRSRDRHLDRQRMADHAANSLRGCLETLRWRTFGDREQSLLNAIDTAIAHVLSPLGYRLMAGEKPLTRRELVIAFLIRHGRGTQQIAQLTGLSPRTVEGHRSRIRRKLGLPVRQGSLVKALTALEEEIWTGEGSPPEATDEAGIAAGAGIVPGDPSSGQEPAPVDRDRSAAGPPTLRALFPPNRRRADSPYQNRLMDDMWLLIQGMQQGEDLSSNPMAAPVDTHPLRPVCEALFVLQQDIQALFADLSADLNALERGQRVLLRKSLMLEKKNRHLKSLLEARPRDRRRLEDHLLCNASSFVMPLIDALTPCPDTEEAVGRLRLEVLEFIRPLRARFSTLSWLLSERELDIAHRIRRGQTSRAIGDVLGISTRTVETYRDHLRRKLGIKHKKANLRSYLLSLEP
jgi:DNA-binding CsgD family transcriptional regulator